MPSKKINTLIICVFIALISNTFADKKNDLSWIGFLKLPKAKSLKESNLKKTKKPEFWKKWEKQGKPNLKWLPQTQNEKTKKINDKLVVPLVSKDTKKDKRRKNQ
jgi:hypothetical protein